MRVVKEFGIVGLGYVGLPLAMEFVSARFGVVGVDIDRKKIKALNSGTSHIADVASSSVATAVDSGMFEPTTDFAALRDVDTISICVPTPVGKSHDPDVSFVTSAATSLSKIIRPGQTIILESTVYPGATEELVAPILEQSGMKAGEDFMLAFSPERIDPGRVSHPIREIPKVVGGVNQASTDMAVAAYAKVFDHIVTVGSTREAEMTKLLENTFRAVNIGLVNELAIMAHGMGIDIWSVIDAASSKPFGFMPFYPGPGWGGHCIPVDPFYLTWRARMDGYESGFIEQAGRINNRMPNYVVERISDLLNGIGKPLRDSRLLLIGMAYKKDVGDTRESPAIDVADILAGKGARVTYHDPHVPEVELASGPMQSTEISKDVLQAQDCVVILTDHSVIDYRRVLDHSRMVFDTRNATSGLREHYPNAFVL